ncbi:MAG: DoxX family protein [Candidatus Dormibacteria bacterium]
MRTLIRTAGRFLLSGIFVYSGYGMLNNSERYAKIAADALPMVPNEPMIAKVQGAAMLVAGTTLALGFMPKTSARVLALTLIPSTIIGHPFWKSEKPDERRASLVHFLKNAGLFGGLLYISADKRTQRDPED